MKDPRLVVMGCIAALFVLTGTAVAEEDACVECHKQLSPGQVQDWAVSKHAEVEVTCSTCHGEKHTSADDYALAEMPSEAVCGDCHEDQLNQFSRGKHNMGWISMNAMPVTHLEPDELMEGGRGCGGCHNMGIKTEAQKKEQLEKGYRYNFPKNIVN